MNFCVKHVSLLEVKRGKSDSRTLEGSVKDPFGPRRLPWAPFRVSLTSPCRSVNLPRGPFRTHFGARHSATLRRGDGREMARDLFWWPVPLQGKGAEAT